MELDELRQLFELLKETDITDVQIEKDGTKVRVRREKFLSSFDMSHAATSVHHLHTTPSAQMKSLADSAAEEEAQQRLITVTAPLVGTLYSSSNPNSEPFVKEGDKIQKGQVLCIIEAMKLMNEIESEVDGIVRRRLVENGQPVEYGEPLFLVEPY